jgi:hypothetical protein
MNIVTNCTKYDAVGLRDPSVTRYAVFDFGNSQHYPRDVSLRDFRATPWFNFSNYDLPFRTGVFNPFAVDFLGVALVLQRRVRVRLPSFNIPLVMLNWLILSAY